MNIQELQNIFADVEGWNEELRSLKDDKEKIDYEIELLEDELRIAKGLVLGIVENAFKNTENNKD